MLAAVTSRGVILWPGTPQGRRAKRGESELGAWEWRKVVQSGGKEEGKLENRFSSPHVVKTV